MLYFKPGLNVLLLSPHPDDVEYSMSGTVFSNPSVNFYIGIMSEGGQYDKTKGDQEIRFVEVTEFWRGVKNVKFLFAQKRPITNTPMDAMIQLIEMHLENTKICPDMIFVPALPDSHREHELVSLAGNALVRKEKLSLVQYRTPSTLPEWTPNWYVDIEKVIDRKLERLACFSSQNKRKYYMDENIKAFHQDYYAQKRGVKFSEQFKIINLFSN